MHGACAVVTLLVTRTAVVVSCASGQIWPTFSDEHYHLEFSKLYDKIIHVIYYKHRGDEEVLSEVNGNT